MSHALCPNCGIGIPDTPVDYDEVLYAHFSSRASSRGLRARSFRGMSTYGRVALCAPCATAYRRMARLRATGHKALNYGFAVLMIGAVVFALLVSSVPAWGQGLTAYLLASPVALGMVSLLAGAALIAIAAVMKRSATRFLAHAPTQSAPAMPSAAPAASTLLVTPAQPSDPESRAATRATRARRRRWRHRLGCFGLSAAWIIAVIAAFAIILLTIGHYSLFSQTAHTFDDPLTQVSQGWTNSGACTFHDGAYHIAPPGSRFGVTCLAPAGDYKDFTLSVTAQLGAGITGAGYGVTFHYQDGSGYVFAIRADGHADLRLLSTGSITPLSPVWTFDAAAGEAVSHTLGVHATGADFALFVDGNQVATFSDGRYASGQVGLFVSEPGMDVAFTNFYVSDKT